MSGEGFRSVGGSETLRWGRSNPPLGETPTPVGAQRHPRAEAPSAASAASVVEIGSSRPVSWNAVRRFVQLSKIKAPKGLGNIPRAEGESAKRMP